MSPALTRKVGPFPVWGWGVAIAGGLLLGLYMRRRAKSTAQRATVDPNAGLDALNGFTGFGMADPNSGLDSGGLISGLMQQNQDALSAILALAGGGGSPPAIGDPATYEPSPVSTPTATIGSSSAGAGPTGVYAAPAVGPAIDEPTYSPPAPADPAYPLSFYTAPTIIDTGTVTNAGVPLQETAALAQGAQFMSAASSSTGGVGGAGYLLLSDKTMRPVPGVNVAM